MAEKQTDLDKYSASDFSSEELTYRLRQTREWSELQKRIEKGEIESGMRLSTSDLEIALPYLFRHVGYSVDLPGPRDEGTTVASVVGISIHESQVLFRSILEGDIPRDLDRKLPTNKPGQNEPYKRILETHCVEPQVGPDLALEILESGWTVFHKDPGLVEKERMQPLFKFRGLPDRDKEVEIRLSKENYEAGLRMARRMVVDKYNSDPQPEAFPEYFEVLVVANYHGLQLVGRLDMIGAFQDKYRRGIKVRDLKTGAKTPQSSLTNEIFDLQSGVMLIVAEKLGAKNLRSGYLKLKEPGKAIILYKVDPDSPKISRQPLLIYEWFDKRTGEVEYEEVDIKDRAELNRKIAWLGEAILTFKPMLKDCMATGLDREAALGKPHTISRKIARPTDPNALLQLEMDFSTPTPQAEFEQIAKDFNAALDQVEKRQNPREDIDKLRQKRRKVFRIGVFETEEVCEKCGSKMVQEYSFHIRGNLVSQLKRVDKCGTGCGAFPRKSIELVANKNILLSEGNS